MCRKEPLFLLVLASIAGFFVLGNLCGEEPAVAPPAPPQKAIISDAVVKKEKIPREEIIRQALAKPIELNFVDVPLEKVAESLREKLRIPILLDKKYLTELGIALDTPISFSISDISAKSALSHMFRNLNLKAVIQHDVLLITTTEAADNIEEVRVYDVTDLVQKTESKDGGPDFDSLIDLITSCVRPTTWESSGPGPIAPFKAAGINALVFWQLQEVHEDVKDLFTRLRALRNKPKKNNIALTEPTTKDTSSTDIASTASPFTPREEKIRQTLAKPIELEFVETPLEKVVEKLHEKLRVPILLDITFLKEAGIARDAPVTFSISNISGNTAIAWMLRDLGLSVVIWNEVLLITTPEEADSFIKTYVYDVSDLICMIGEKNDEPDYDPLIELIYTCVRPTSWASVGGPGTVQPFYAVGIKALVISSTQDVNEEVVDLLSQLRANRRTTGNNEKTGTDTATAKSELVGNSIKASSFSPQEEKIRRTLLSRAITLQFKATPLKKIIEYIQKNANIQVVIDNKQIAELNIDADTQMTATLVGMALSDALDSMLREKGLDWTIFKGILVITTPKAANSLVEIRTYDISDLPTFRNKQGEPVPDYNHLLDIIRRTAYRTIYGESFGYSSPLSAFCETDNIVSFEGNGIKAIIVNQKWAVHQKTGKLLSDLRKLRKYPLSKEEIEKLPPLPEQIRLETPPQYKVKGGFF